MSTYVFKRLLQALPVLFGITLAVYFVTASLPGDPVRLFAGQHASEEVLERQRKALGLDKSLPERYLRWLGKTLRGDLGVSSVREKPVAGVLGEGFLVTFQLACGAMFLAILLGTASGAAAAWRQGSVIDRGVRLIAVAGVSLPVFWTAMLLIMVFGTGLGLLPVSGWEEGSYRYLVLPAVCLGFFSAGGLSRITRAAALDELSSDYILAARARGVGDFDVLARHALPNAILPVLTTVGANFASLLAGAVLTETVFGLPGLGRTIFDAVFQRDYAVLTGGILFIAVIFVFTNLVLDIMYAWLDPRVRYAKTG